MDLESMPEFLTPKQLSRIINIPEATLTLYRKEGNGVPFVRFGKRAIRYRKTDVEAYVYEHTYQETTDTKNTPVAAGVSIK